MRRWYFGVSRISATMQRAGATLRRSDTALPYRIRIWIYSILGCGY
jgi:hypothetical protein